MALPCLTLNLTTRLCCLVAWFWLGLGVAVLVKGPVVPLIAGLASEETTCRTAAYPRGASSRTPRVARCGG